MLTGIGLVALLSPTVARATTPVFQDGFETGDLLAWSDSTTPGARASLSGYQWHPALDDHYAFGCQTHTVPNHQGQFTFDIRKDGTPYLNQTLEHTRTLSTLLPPGEYEVRCEALNEVTGISTGPSAPYAFTAPETIPQTTLEIEPWFPQNNGHDYSFLCGPVEEQFPGFTGSTHWWVRRPSEPAPWDVGAPTDYGTFVPNRKKYQQFQEDGPWMMYCFWDPANYTGISAEYPEEGRGSLLLNVTFTDP